MSDLRTSGSTGNRAKYGAATRIENERRVSDMIAKAPPKDPAEPYNGGLGKALKTPAEPERITKLGVTEIRYEDDNPYWSPIIKIGRTKRYHKDGDVMALSVYFYVYGRAGKQVNWYSLSGHLKGNKVEVSTQGAVKSLISLEEWRAFIDTVPVQVAEVSKNTVGPITPELEKMARDVHAFRRKSPTCKEWKAELATAAESATDVVALEEIGIGDGYDWTCGMVRHAVFVSQLRRAMMVEFLDRFDKARLFSSMDRSERELDLELREWDAWPIVDRVMQKRAEGYWDQLVEVPTPAILPQDLQAATESEPTPAAVRIWRNGDELVQPCWKQKGGGVDGIGGQDYIEYLHNYGIPDAPLSPHWINSVMIETLIKRDVLRIEGEMPEWVRQVIKDHAANKEARKLEASKPKPTPETGSTPAPAAAQPVPDSHAERLFTDIKSAVFNMQPEDETLTVSDGFEIYRANGGLELRIKHPALPGRSTVIASRNAIDDQLKLKASLDDATRALSALIAANKEKRQAAKAALPESTRIYKRSDRGEMVECRFVSWSNDGLTLVNGTDHEVMFRWHELKEMVRKGEMVAEGKMPDQMRQILLGAVYTRDPKAFVATRSGGGGFIWFEGFYRSLNWIATNCFCAHCGSAIDRYKLSDVRADGLVEKAFYRTCHGTQHHIIRMPQDLKWQPKRQAKDEKLRAQGKVKDVQEAYAWLHAKPPIESEAVPY